MEGTHKGEVLITDGVHTRSRKKAENTAAPGGYKCLTSDHGCVSKIGLFSYIRS